MRYLIQWVLILVTVLILVGVGFSLYGNFFLDYSLDNLEKALVVAGKEDQQTSPVSQEVYQNFIEGIALDEVAQEDVSVKNVVFLGLASRSLRESVARAGNQRAGIYLEQILTEKKAARPFLLRTFDSAYYFFKNLYQSLREMIRYAMNRLSKGTFFEGAEEYSSILLISQAQEKVKKGEYDEAANLYLQFVRNYPQSEERGFVSIALAQVFAKQKKYEDAKSVLRQIQKEYYGREEGDIAANFLTRINTLEDRQQLIEKLKKVLLRGGTAEETEKLQLRLAMAQFSVYQFEEAEELLVLLKDSPDEAIREKAQFYLGWLYKTTEKLDQSAELMLGLVESPNLDDDIRLGLHVELADTYYLQNDIEKALEFYEVVSGETQQTFRALEVAEDAWKSLADFERANIYYFKLGKQDIGDEILQELAGAFQNFSTFDILKNKINTDVNSNLRQRAFRQLAVGNVQAAFHLMSENLKIFPRDPWTHSGLATIYLLFADLEKAQQHALNGYKWYSDEYTTAVLAYVYGYLEDYKGAINLYEKAIRKNPDYLAARFNLACMYLELKQHQKALSILEATNKRVGIDENFLKAKVLNNMGYTLWWLDRPEESLKYFEQAVKKAPGFEIAERNLKNMRAGQSPEMVEFTA